MRRGRGVMANPDKTRAWQQRSRENQRLDPDERAVREAVFASDGHRCRLRDLVGEPFDIAGRIVEVPPCAGVLTYQHRRKASAQGAYNVANGATLCWFHNGWVETEPDAAKLADPYLVVRDGDPEWEQLGRRAERGR